MPQLMPLYWIISTFMVVLLLIIMLDIFYYKMVYSFLIDKMEMMKSMKINFKW